MKRPGEGFLFLMRNGVVDPLFGPTPCHHVHQPSKSVQFMSEDQSSFLFLARPTTFGGWGSSTSSNEQQMLCLPCPIVSALKVLDKQRWFSRPVSDTEFRLLFGGNLLPLLGSISQSEVWRGGLRDLVKKTPSCSSTFHQLLGRQTLLQI